NEFLRLRSRRGEWLLHENVLAIFKRRLGQVEVRPHGRNDGDRIDICRLDSLAAISRDTHSWVGLLCAPLKFRALVTNKHQFAIFRVVEITGDAGSPV